MHPGPKTCYKPYVPSKISVSREMDQNSIYCSQYIGDNIRKGHPPGLHIDTSLLETLDSSRNRFSLHVVTKSSPNLAIPGSDGKITSMKQNEGDGFISPLELPPRLTAIDHDDSDKTDCDAAVLWTPPPVLDIVELQRRLESIARIQRLSEAGLLQNFLTFVSTRF